MCTKQICIKFPLLCIKLKMVQYRKYLTKNFSAVDHSYPTRFALDSFQLPRSSKTSRFSITLRGPKLGNQFETKDKKSSTTLTSFKRTFKKQDSRF